MKIDELKHYGTPRHSGRYPYGSGKRPYQGERHNALNLSQIGDKQRLKSNIGDIESIYSSLTTNEKDLINGYDSNGRPPETFYDDNTAFEYRIYSNVVKIKDVPVAFIDYWRPHEHSNELDVAIGVRNDPRYRHAGIASRMVQNGEKAIKELREKGILDQSVNIIKWYANTENYKSIQTAIKAGFEDKGKAVWDGELDVPYDEMVKRIKNDKTISKSAKKERVNNLNPYQMLEKKF